MLTPLHKKRIPAFFVFILLVSGCSLGILLHPFLIYIVTLILLFSVIFVVLKRIDFALLSGLVLFSAIYTDVSMQLLERPFISKCGLTVGNRIVSLTGRNVTLRGEKIDDGFFIRIKGRQYSYKGVNYVKSEDIDTLSSLFVPIYKFRKGIINRLRSGLPGVIGSIGVTFLLGERKGLPEFVKRRFRSSGASHLLAVSGLHTGIIFFILSIVLSIFPLQRRFIPLVSSIVLVPYIFLTGFRVSVIRAFLMLLFYSIGVSMEKKSEPLNAVGCAGIIILLLDPLAVLSISFQLSFLAVIGILLFFEYFTYKLKNVPKAIRNYLLYPALFTTSAQLFTVPVVYYNFGYVPLYSIFANIILIPLVTLFIGGIVFFLLVPPMSSLIIPGVWFIGIVLNKIMMAFQNLPFSIITGRPSMLIFLIYPAIAGMFLYLRLKSSP